MSPIPRCRLGEHAGMLDADAHTAAQLVCAQIARAGASSSQRFRVSSGSSDGAWFSPEEEGSAPGSTVDAREIRLQNVEEVSGSLRALRRRSSTGRNSRLRKRWTTSSVAKNGSGKSKEERRTWRAAARGPDARPRGVTRRALRNGQSEVRAQGEHALRRRRGG